MNAFGIDIRGGSGLLIRTFLNKDDGSLLTSGNTYVYFEEPQDDGSFKSYDFNTNDFKTGALTTPQASLTHRKGNNNTRDTGLWTYVHSNISGFTEGNIYFVQTSSDYASPKWQTREFQYGSGVFASVVHISPSSINTISDGVLGRDFAAVNNPASRSLLNANRVLRNKVDTSQNVLYVYSENDTSIAWSGSLVTSGTAQPIVTSDPY